MLMLVAEMIVYCIDTISFQLSFILFQGVCTEAGMYALRERRVHVTQEDFEMAVAKVTICFMNKHVCILF